MRQDCHSPTLRSILLSVRQLPVCICLPQTKLFVERSRGRTAELSGRRLKAKQREHIRRETESPWLISVSPLALRVSALTLREARDQPLQR